MVKDGPAIRHDILDFCLRELGTVFESLDSTLSWRNWCVDDLWCESIGHSGAVATLKGISHWLEGGQNCERFRIDVALDCDPLLYSYKFTYRKTEKQVLYVGKEPDGWKLGT